MDRLTTISKRINEHLANLEEYVETYKVQTRKMSTSLLDKNEETVYISNIQELSQKIKHISESVKNKIYKLKELLRNVKGKEKEVVEWHVNAHSKRLITLTNRFREHNFNFKKNEENRMKIMYRTANTGVDEDKVDEYVSKNASSTKVQSFFVLGDNSKKLKLDEAMRRQEEIRKINETSEEIREITEMVTELIYSQSSNIDNFADGIFEVEENTKQSNFELEQTLQYKIKRKKFWRSVIFFLLFCFGLYISYTALKNEWFGSNKEHV